MTLHAPFLLGPRPAAVLPQVDAVASLFDLEAARRNAVMAQSALVELQAEPATAWISLYRALGGGWSAAEPAPAPPSAVSTVSPSAKS